MSEGLAEDLSDATRLQFTACGTCGAVVAVKGRDGGGIDNVEAHQKWHADLPDVMRGDALRWRARNAMSPGRT
jgi:hypothetical protein